jgi:hypothetical protein
MSTRGFIVKASFLIKIKKGTQKPLIAFSSLFICPLPMVWDSQRLGPLGHISGCVLKALRRMEGLLLI